ncbi:MAG: sel1 repeat family protein [Saprospiraceae bacterium]|nr:sel1 repeat family protein [Saprospiraceae bacterium]
MIEKISNSEHAKEFYFLWGGSHFGMWKEAPELFQQYLNLKISKEIENSWQKEIFDNLIKDLLSSSPQDLGSKFYHLKHSIAKDKYYITESIEVLKKIYNKISIDQIPLMLVSLIGNNATRNHGGLIFMAFDQKLKSVALKFYEFAKYYLDLAKINKISTVHIKSDLVDVIKYCNIKESKEYINNLINEDNIEKFGYYLEGALENNIYSMKQLAYHYFKGLGCTKDINESIKWYKKAASLGDADAYDQMKKITDRTWFEITWLKSKYQKLFISKSIKF